MQMAGIKRTPAHKYPQGESNPWFENNNFRIIEG